MAIGPLALALLVSACASDVSCPGPPCGLSRVLVSHVIDGDTLHVYAACEADADCIEGGSCQSDGWCDNTLTVRLMGLNTGEIAKTEAEIAAGEPNDCMGTEAKDRLVELVQDRVVTLEFDPVTGCRGAYGRHLAYVHVGGELVQERLLEEGLACVYWYTNEPDRDRTRYPDVIEEAAARAKAAAAGIWSEDAGVCGGRPFPDKCSH